jgi:hypothetical protein
MRDLMNGVGKEKERERGRGARAAFPEILNTKKVNAISNRGTGRMAPLFEKVPSSAS